MAGLWNDETQSYVELNGSSYVQDQILYEKENVTIFCAHDKENSDKKKIVTRIILNCSMYDLKEDSLLERIEKINGKFHRIQKEYEKLKIAAEKDKNILSYDSLNYNIKTEPYEICIDLESDYIKFLGQTGYYEKAPTLKHGEVIQIALFLCYAVKTMINAGVYHRMADLTGVVKDKNGEYRLGNAAFWRNGKENASSYSCRERSYIAPELFGKKDDFYEIHFERVDEQTEIYAIGAFLYELLDNNHILFAEESSDMDEIERRRLSGEIPPIPDTGTKRLGIAVVKACSPRHMRYKTLDEFIIDLEDIYNKMPFQWKNECINGSFYDDSNLNQRPVEKKEEKQEKVVSEDKQISKKKKERKKKEKKSKTDIKHEKVDYGEMSEKDLNKASKKVKVGLTALLVSVVLVLVILFFGFSNHKYTKVNEMIENRTYAAAMKEIQTLYSNGKDIDDLCQTYIDACIETGEVQRIAEAVELMSDEVPVAYYEQIVDAVISMGRENAAENILYSLYEKGEEYHDFVLKYYSE